MSRWAKKEPARPVGPHSRTRCRADKIPRRSSTEIFSQKGKGSGERARGRVTKLLESNGPLSVSVLICVFLAARSSNSFKHSPRWSHDKLLPEASKERRARHWSRREKTSTILDAMKRRALALRRALRPALSDFPSPQSYISIQRSLVQISRDRFQPHQNLRAGRRRHFAATAAPLTNRSVSFLSLSLSIFRRSILSCSRDPLTCAISSFHSILLS